jgi:hypothetical protein
MQFSSGIVAGPSKFVDFAAACNLKIELFPHQIFYPDLTFSHDPTGRKFAVDIKSTYRTSADKVNGMTRRCIHRVLPEERQQHKHIVSI